MATVIDALMITLGLDTSKFKQESKEASATLAKTSKDADKASKEEKARLKEAGKARKELEKQEKELEKQRQKAAKEAEERAKRVSQGLGKLKGEVLGLLAVFTAGMGIKSFVQNTIGQTAALSRMSQNLDMSAKSLAKWQLANKNAGGTVEGMTAQLQEAQQAVTDYRLGVSNSANNAFWTTGLAKHEDFKDAETLLRARSQAIAQITQRYGVGVGRSKASEMGISEDTFNLLKQGPAAMEAARRAQEKLAQAQASAADKAERFRQKWDAVQNKLEAVGVEIVSKLLPYLDRFAAWLDQNQGQIEAWANQAVKAVEDFVKWADKAADSVGGWKTVLVGLLALNILSAVSPLVSLAGALLGVSKAMGLIGTAGPGALSVLGKVARAGGVGGALLLHSGELNKGEDDELARLRALGDADFAKRGIGPDGKPLAKNASSNQIGSDVAAYLAETDRLIGAKQGLSAAQAMVESGGDASAVSRAGARGLMQVMPKTQEELERRAGRKFDANNPMDSAIMHRMLMQENIKQFGNVDDALRAYNGGWDRSKWGNAETSAYVGKINRRAYNDQGPIPGAMNAVQVAQAARAGASQGPVSNNTSTSETNFNGPINIYPQGGDAKSIASAMKPALRSVFGQSNTGVA